MFLPLYIDLTLHRPDEAGYLSHYCRRWLQNAGNDQTIPSTDTHLTILQARGSRGQTSACVGYLYVNGTKRSRNPFTVVELVTGQKDRNRKSTCFVFLRGRIWERYSFKVIFSWLHHLSCTPPTRAWRFGWRGILIDQTVSLHFIVPSFFRSPPAAFMLLVFDSRSFLSQRTAAV